MSALLQHISPEILLLGIVVLVILLVVLMLVVLWRTKKKQEDQASEDQQQEAAEKKEAESSPKGLPIHATAEMAIRRSVSSAIRFLRENSTGRDFRYRAPWLLVVGAAQSGKTTMLEHSGIGLSLREGATDFGARCGLQWRFFDAGVLLDVPGDFFLHADKPGSDERGWKSLLRNLQRYRPGRPLDGIVLTVPCTELMGETAVSPAVIGQRASQIVDKLWQLEKWLGICLPVYVVVTKCDLIAGFKSLAQQLPSAYHGQIFGWSNPNNIQAVFDPAWIDQGFDELAQNLNRLQSEIFTERHEIDDAPGLFLFQSKLQELRKLLRIYLGQIFKQAAYRESHQFRGFYFVGDSSEPEEMPEPVRARAAAASTSGFVVANEPASGSVLGLSSPAPSEPPQNSPVFITDLFEAKIFPEYGLARPPAKLTMAKGRTVRWLQAATLAVTLGLAAGVWIVYPRMVDIQERALDSLKQIVDDLPELASTSDQAKLVDQRKSGSDEANTEASYTLIHAMGELTSNRFRTILMPSSWAFPIDEKVEKAMVPAFERIVFKTFRQELEERVNKLLQESAADTAAISSHSDVPVTEVEKSDAYKKLHQFITDLQLLELNISRYNDLASRDTGDVEAFLLLEGYLHHHDPPEDFGYIDNHYFQMALKEARGEVVTTTDPPLKPTDPKDVQKRAAVKMERLTRSLFEQWIAENPLLTYLDQLGDEIDKLGEQQLETRAELEKLKGLLEQAQSIVHSPGLAWMGQGKFKLDDSLSAVTTAPIASSKYFFLSATQKSRQGATYSSQDDLINFIAATGAASFKTLRNELDHLGTSLTGDLVDVGNDQISLSSGTESVHLLLVNLLNIPYMQRDPAMKIRASIEPSEHLLWSKDTLEEATTLKDSYDRFVKEQLDKATATDIQRIAFNAIALKRLDQNMEDLIARAQVFQSVKFDPETELMAEVQSFQDASASLSTLLAQFQELKLWESQQALLQVTSTHAASLLSKIDRQFDGHLPYTPTGNNFDRWNGQNTPDKGGFDVHNADEMDQYLAFQRQQVQQYATAATPLVSFLKVHHPRRQSDMDLAAKWGEIIFDAQQYNSKIPGTSLAGLEDFLKAEIEKVTPENCQGGVLAVVASSGGNYFVRRRETLRQALANRCYYLSEQNAVRQYARLADLFNQRLSGRFPFSPLTTEQLPSEADPQDLAEFYRLFDTYSKSIHAGLQNGNFGSSYLPVLGFLNQMDALRPLFSSLFTGEPNAVPTFDFVPVFRVNQSREIKGNQIIDWTLQVGPDTFRYREPERVGRWSFGQPVKLMLRWAKDSPEQPAPVRGASDARTNSRIVSYEFRDSWALLNMVVRHEASSNDFDRMVDPEPQTLAFTVSGTTQDPEAKVFVRIKLRPPGKPENLRLRGFPTEAPSLGGTPVRTAEGNQ